jgi:hypothetical protein
MKSRAMLTTALAAGVLYLAAASSAQAFDLLDRMLSTNGGCGCEAAPSCCEPDPCCQKRVGLLDRLHRKSNCCEPVCGVEAACGVEPTCCDPCNSCKPKRPSLLDHLRSCRKSCAPACEPACGAELACHDPCDSCCAPKRPGLLSRLFSCRTSCAPACEPSCGAEPSCCH